MQQLKQGRLLGLGLLAAILLLRHWDPLPLEVMRLRSFDVLERMFPRQSLDRPVTIVAIDDRSLAALGQWPWPRTYVAKLVESIAGMGAAVIGFDVLFAERDRMSPGEIASSIDGLDSEMRTTLGKMPSNDKLLAEAIRKSGIVVLGESGAAQQLAPPSLAAPLVILGRTPSPFLRPYSGVVQALAELERAAAGRGMLTLEPESDGVVRRVPLVIRIGELLFPALSFDMLRVATGESLVVRTGSAGIQELIVHDVATIPTDANGRIWIRYAPHERDIYVSAADVLKGDVDPKMFEGKLVLVGYTATGLSDLKATPVDGALPGVEVHAQILETVIGGTYISRPDWADGAEQVVLLLSGLLVIILVPISGARWTLGVLAGITTLLLAGSAYAFTTANFLLDPTVPTATTLVLYIALVYVGHTLEETRRRQIRSAFAQYLAPALVEQLAQSPEKLKLGGERRRMTVLFSDIRGFTALSERCDPAKLTQLINRFMTPMTRVIMGHDGTIDKYMGDAIMAFWNAPIDVPDHSGHACKAALAMMVELEKLNAALAAENEGSDEGAGPLGYAGVTPNLAIGIGINTGDCIVGNMGSELRFDYSVMGDTVNLASRLESLSQYYGVPIVIGEETAHAISEWAVLELDIIAVKGKAKAVRVFTILGDAAAAALPGFESLRLAQAGMLDAYRRQDWAAARASLADCDRLDHSLSMFYKLYESRIEGFLRDAPPADWTGIYVAESK